MSIGATRVEGAAVPGYVYGQAPRNVYWEMTRACDLACRHCRADAQPERDPGELTTAEGKALMADVKAMGSMLILTGGDPMKRTDLFELITHGRDLHLPIAVTPSTTPTLTREAVERFATLGISAMGVSLDGPTPAVHDRFRNVDGTFDNSMRALGWARELSVPVQINTTVTQQTLPHLRELYTLLRAEAAPPVRRWSLFVLIPVGRGLELGAPTAAQIEQLFAWVYETARDAPFHMGTVEAPHYRRYWVQRKLAEGATMAEIERLAPRMGFGIRDGNGVVFVSHRGDVYPAGFLPHPHLGNVRNTPLSRLYRESPELKVLRDADAFHGPCGSCDHRFACGGSRARAHAMTGDHLGSDPLCSLVA
ncbi:MAG: TIGR04053 family radical SAM/SPASM domain-containing protein [Myxococcales bacterium]|nr:TIGR04053 family radical SAM/SPASM domain-containing protein [Myxococcales bacterium]